MGISDYKHLHVHFFLFTISIIIVYKYHVNVKYLPCEKGQTKKESYL